MIIKDYLKCASDIIEGGQLNKITVLITQPPNPELFQTLRRLFQYFEECQMFTKTYGNEWAQWFPPNYRFEASKNQVDMFLNLKWTFFIMILFQNQAYDELLLNLDHTAGCPPYRRLVEISLSKIIEVDYDAEYFEICGQLQFSFDILIGLIKRLPENIDKLGFTKLVQNMMPKMSDEQKLTFTKLVNTHIVDKVDNPLILANFLQNNVDKGSTELQVISLQSMLILMTRHHYNLDNFYAKLLQLAQNPEAYNSRFMKLLEVATKSTKVSKEILLNIVERVLTQSLKTSCSQQFWAASFTFNLFKRHPTLKQEYILGKIKVLQLYQDHWYPEIKRIINYLQDDLECFDYLTDISEMNDQQLLDAFFI